MKSIVLLFFVLIFNKFSIAQFSAYDNFEGDKKINYGIITGTIDTAAKNPSVNKVNFSVSCAKYIRNKSKSFDVVKMNLNNKLEDVKLFTSYAAYAPKIKIKVYTTAPIGTLIELQLTKKGGDKGFPVGVNSQFQVYTTKTNEWEELEFNFAQIPRLSEVKTSDIDQLILLFNPNSYSAHTYYFDELTGPAIDTVTISGAGGQ